MCLDFCCYFFGPGVEVCVLYSFYSAKCASYTLECTKTRFLALPGNGAIK